MNCGCGLTFREYWYLSRVKFEASGWHLDRLAEFARDPRPKIVPRSAMFTRDGIYVPFVAYADGAALELFGAFDAFAVAVAHRFDHPDRDRAQFANLRRTGTAESTAVDDRMAAIRTTDEWTRIAGFRHPAAHRDVVAAEVRFGKDQPAAAVLDRRERDVIADLRGLHGWANGALGELWDLSADWRRLYDGQPLDDPGRGDPPSAG